MLSCVEITLCHVGDVTFAEPSDEAGSRADAAFVPMLTGWIGDARYFNAGPCELRLGVYESFDTLCIYLESDSLAGDPERNFWVKYRCVILRFRGSAGGAACLGDKGRNGMT